MFAQACLVAGRIDHATVPFTLSFNLRIFMPNNMLPQLA